MSEENKLSQHIKEIEKKVDKILGYFYNDNNTGQKGLMQRMSDNEEDIRTLKTQREKDIAVKNGQIAVYATVGSVITVIGSWIVKLLIPLFLKLA